MEPNNQPQKPKNSQHSSQKPEADAANAWKSYTGLGVQIVAEVLLGVFAGRWLDTHFETKNAIYTIILSCLMIVVALYQFIRQAFKN